MSTTLPPLPEPEEQCCGNCYWRKASKDPKNIQHGECRVGPPTLYSISVPKRGTVGQVEIMVQVRSAYPPVELADWGCAKHVFKDAFEEGSGP